MDKCATLEEEYAELQKESLEITALLRRAKQNKRLLQAEVRFLRDRVAMLEKISTPMGESLLETDSSDQHHALEPNYIDHGNPCEFLVATNTNYIDLDDD